MKSFLFFLHFSYYCLGGMEIFYFYFFKILLPILTQLTVSFTCTLILTILTLLITYYFFLHLFTSFYILTISFIFLTIYFFYFLCIFYDLYLYPFFIKDLIKLS